MVKIWQCLCATPQKHQMRSPHPPHLKFFERAKGPKETKRTMTDKLPSVASMGTLCVCLFFLYMKVTAAEWLPAVTFTRVLAQYILVNLLDTDLT